MLLIDFRIGQIFFITDCIILMETKCKFAIFITSKLWIFSLEKAFSLKLMYNHTWKTELIWDTKIPHLNGFWSSISVYANRVAYIREKKLLEVQYVYGLHSDQLTLTEKNSVLLMCGSCSFCFFFFTSVIFSLQLIYLRKTTCHKELYWQPRLL